MGVVLGIVRKRRGVQDQRLVIGVIVMSFVPKRVIVAWITMRSVWEIEGYCKLF